MCSKLGKLHCKFLTCSIEFAHFYPFCPIVGPTLSWKSFPSSKNCGICLKIGRKLISVTQCYLQLFVSYFPGCERLQSALISLFCRKMDFKSNGLDDKQNSKKLRKLKNRHFLSVLTSKIHQWFL